MPEGVFARRGGERRAQGCWHPTTTVADVIEREARDAGAAMYYI